MKSSEFIPQGPVTFWSDTDNVVSPTKSHGRPIAPLPSLSSPAKPQEIFYDESLIQPLPFSHRGICHTVVNYGDNALNEDDRCNRVGLPGSEIGQELSRASRPVGSTVDNALTEGPSHECSCTACLSVGALKDWPDQGMPCRFPACSYFTEGHSDHILHERGHFQKAGSSTFHCMEQVCPFTSKRWPDLVRHYTVKHCTSPKKFQFPCPVPWCKYNGNNGFARKDKLKSHYKNIHEGKPGPVKAGRVIKPATLKPKVPGLEGSASR